MKIPSTLRRSGGAGTKLKNKKNLSRIAVTAAAVLGGLFLCRMLFLLFDRFMNGFFVDWFEEVYIRLDWRTLEEGDTGYYTKSIRWGPLKDLLLQTLVVTVVLWILSVRIVSLLYSSVRERKVLQKAGELIGDYMLHDRESGEVFPPEYAAVAARMSEIKSGMLRQEQLLREEAGRKNDLITYLAHDLKTPLTSVIGYLSLLKEAPDMPGEQKARYVNITLEKAMHLERLINEFFEITRYNLQQIVLEKETVDLSFLLIQLTDEFYPILTAHGNTVRVENGEGLSVFGDGEKLARVFNNILKNAVAYSYPDTEILIRCSREPDFLVLRFQNRGRTIPRSKLDAIFEKFYRLDDARSTNTGGAGLGLAIAREIVTLHGGAITASSEKEVTTFTVTLPAKE